MVDQGGESFPYQVSYQDALGTVLTVVKRFDGGGSAVHLEMEPDPTPRPRDGLVMEIAKRAGSGSHDPVRMPTQWAEDVVLPDGL